MTDLQKYAFKVALGTVLLLLVPFLAMQFSEEVSWSLRDFAMAGILLFGTGMIYGWVSRNSSNTTYRLALGLAIGAGLFMVWSNLAVGLIGSENEPANLMYFGLLAIAFLGSILGRFKPQGMMRAMFATAGAQGLITLIALVTGMRHYPGSSVTEILGVNGFFLLLWLGSALLFRNAALEEKENNDQPG